MPHIQGASHRRAKCAVKCCHRLAAIMCTWNCTREPNHLLARWVCINQLSEKKQQKPLLICRWLACYAISVHMQAHPSKDSNLILLSDLVFRQQVCDAAFCRKPYLEVHMRTHTGERPFQCDLCLKRFSQKSSLNTHKRIHTGQSPFIYPKIVFFLS